MSTIDNNSKAASTSGATTPQPAATSNGAKSVEMPTDAKATAATADGYSSPYGVYSGQPDILYPNTPGYVPPQYVPVGGVVLAEDDITYNANRRTKTIKVRNTGDRPIQIGSHFHFFEVNRYMEFDRPATFGYRLNIPATTAIRFEPGEEKEVELVTYSGKMRVMGFNGLTQGYAGLEDLPTYYPVHTRALHRMEEYGFKSEPEAEADAEYTTPQK